MQIRNLFKFLLLVSMGLLAGLITYTSEDIRGFYAGDNFPVHAVFLRTANHQDIQNIFDEENYTIEDNIQRIFNNCIGEGMDRVCQHGKIKQSAKYSMLSTTIEGDKFLNYAFNLPLTVQAWRRIGYDSIVVIVGDPYSCRSSTKAQYIIETLEKLDFVVMIFLPGVPANHSVMLSQTCRLFAASLVRDVHDEWNDTYIVTADADIWPINHTFLDLPDGKDITHGFLRNKSLVGHSMPFVPISYIGMKVWTWLDVMTRCGRYSMPSMPSQILEYFHKAFPYAMMSVTKASRGWYMDQGVISLRLAQWMIKDGHRVDRIHYYNRKVTGRINHPRRCKRTDLDDAVDIHLRHYQDEHSSWNVTRDFIKLMYPVGLTQQWSDNYAMGILKRNISHCSSLN